MSSKDAPARTRAARPVLAAALLLSLLPAVGQAAPREALRVQWTSTMGGPVALPAGACAGAQEGVLSEAMPLIGVDPADEQVVKATWSAHGEQLQVAGSSSDGGRTWSTEVVRDATACSGGPRERDLSVNALLDVGAGGTAYFGESWLSPLDAALFEFGIAVHELGSGRPGGEPVAGDVQSQNAAVLADPADPAHVAAAWSWTRQVPNPLTYTPLPNEIRFAESFDGGRTWTPHVVVHAPPAGELAVNPRLVRAADGGLVVLVDQAHLKDFPGGQFGLTPVDFSFLALHSSDRGRTWAAPALLGTGEFYVAERPDAGPAPRLGAVKPDLAAGPGNEVVAVWHDKTRTTVRLARSDDGGRTWGAAQDTVTLPGLPYQVAVAVDGRGTTGLLWYDFREDVPGDAPWTVRPWAAAQTRDGTWSSVPVDEAFDLGAAERCTPGPIPNRPTCAPGSHAGPLGVYPDLEGLPRGFAAAYTVAGHLAQDGLTDARISRLAVSGGPPTDR